MANQATPTTTSGSSNQIAARGGTSAQETFLRFALPQAPAGTTLTAATVPAPATFTCGALGVLSVTFNWAPVPGATSYDVHYGPNGSTVYTVTTTAAQLTTLIDGGKAWVQANMSYGGTTWTSAPTVSRNYTVAVVSLCG